MDDENSHPSFDHDPEVILDRISDVFFALDTEWQITYLSSKAEAIARDALGVSPSTIMGEPLWDVIPQATDSVLYDKFTEAMETQEPVEFETESILRDGWVEVRAYPSDSGLSVYFRDITARKEREREREQRYEAIFNQTYQFTGLMEPDGTLIEANDTALEFGGLDPEDVLGKPFWETYWWQTDEGTQQELREAIDRAADGEFVRYEVEVQGKDENIIIDFSLRPVTDDDGEVTYLIPEGRNITELKAVRRRERKLQRIQEQMEFALNATDSVIWSLDLTTDESTDYGPAKRVFGIEPAGMGEFLDEVVHPDDTEEVGRVFEAVRDGETDVFDVEFRTRPRTEAVEWISSTGYIQETTQEEPRKLIGIATNITERKRRETELQQQNDRLEQFVSVVSHDLRNPLNVAEGRVELAREECDSAHLEPASDALTRCHTLIEELLTLARQGKQAAEVERVSLDTVVENCWANVSTGEATLNVNTNSTVEADRARLQQLLENLLRNAVEHGGERVTVSIGELSQGFYVEDDGAGIPEEERDDIFDAGYSTTATGTGFGLNIVNEIADNHGWEITVTESEAGGARFEITGVESAA